MTNPDLMLVAALLDRSGSMQSIADDTRGGFDAFIAKERQQTGTTLVTLAQFDDEYESVYQNTPIDRVPPLTLEPRGTTASRRDRPVHHGDRQRPGGPARA